jgi:endonuclease/exonuclease/phosphatase family metal-dependent hydrolase
MLLHLRRLVGLIGLSLMGGVLHADDSKPLSVVTYNIRYANPADGPDFWPNRVDAVVSFLSEQDLAGLQEVTDPQLQDLRSRLPDFESYGVGRDDGKQGGEHAPIFYRRDRLKEVKRGTFWLSESPEAVGVAGWDAALPRTCTWMILRDRRSGATMLVANTHFDHRGEQARRNSAKLIVARLRQLAGDLPVILLGDFNCQSGSEPYQSLTADSFLTNARDRSETPPSGPESTWNGFEQIDTRGAIDHIFVREPLSVLDLGVFDPKTSSGRFASDHLPVRARIRFGSTSRPN